MSRRPRSITGELALRPFEAADFAELKGWFRDADEARLWGGPAVRFPVDDAQLFHMLGESLGRNARRRCWSAELDGLLVGHAQALRESRSSTRLGRIAVARDWRGRGIGRRLVGAVIDEVLSDSAVMQISLNVFPRNEAARALYGSLGFADAAPFEPSASGLVQSRRMILERSRWSGFSDI